MTPETGGRALALTQTHGLHCKVLAGFDLIVAIPFERSGNPAWFLPVPATFLVHTDGTMVRTWVNTDFTQRAKPGEILDAVRAL